MTRRIDDTRPPGHQPPDVAAKLAEVRAEVRRRVPAWQPWMTRQVGYGACRLTDEQFGALVEDADPYAPCTVDRPHDATQCDGYHLDTADA